MVTLITGSTGFIGQRLVNSIKSTGGELRVIARKQIPGIDSFEVDFKQQEIPNEALKRVDTIFHLAGYAHDLQSPSDKIDLYQSINVDSTINLAKLAIKNNVKRFIFVSSVKAGGSSLSGECVTEDEEFEPEGIYGKTKRKAEIQLLKLAKNKMHVSILRPSLVYGPGVKGNLFLMMNGIKKGWFPPLPKIGNRRSLVHVDDLVDALLFIANDVHTNGEIYNVTDGEPHSSREIYDALRFVMDKPQINWYIPMFVFDFLSLINKDIRYKTQKLFGDEYYSSKKIQALGFNPSRTLRDMNETIY